MSMKPKFKHSQGSKQRGIALAVSLVLLAVVTLVGIAGVRATTSQQRMARNFFDRGLAFQNAEAGLRVGAQNIVISPIGQRNCGATPCYSNPFQDPNLAADNIISVSTAEFQKGINAASQPQYVTENLGNWQDPANSSGFGQTANAQQYGAQGLALTSTYYRVTARSGDPEESGSRSVVTLQAIYRR